MIHTVKIDHFDPPTATAQEKKVAVVGGKPHFYKPKNVKTAELILHSALVQKDPERPLEGPVKLTVHWRFKSKSHKAGTWRTTRPDTDNLQKALKDILTQRGWWKDDAQVCVEYVTKSWSNDPGLSIEAEEIDDAIDDSDKMEWEWCHDCKEYDQENYCCHRWTKVIRQTVAELEERYKLP